MMQRAFSLIAPLALAIASMLIWSACRQPSAPPPLTMATIVAAWDKAGDYPALQIAYPLDGAFFPPEIVSPTVRWTDDNPSHTAWLVLFHPDSGLLDRPASGAEADTPLPGAVAGLVREPEWRPSANEWARLKALAADGPIALTVLAVDADRPDHIGAAGAIAISFAADPVGAPLFYREVNLPFIDAVKDPSTIRWRFGNIASPTRPPIVLQNLPVCGNCHSFSSDGAWLGMDVDYANSKGSYVITRLGAETRLATSDIITWDDFRPEDNQQTFGLLSMVSPDGRYVISTVKDRSVFVPQPDLAFSQLFFPVKGILAVYDRMTGTFAALPGADDPEYVQSNPNWSPDGQHIVFARARAHELETRGDNILLTAEECAEFLEGGRDFKFDLYRIPFNDGAGGEPEPLAGASHNGRSNFFARYSPDGKWIVYCQAENFMLLQPDSAMFIIPAQGGEPRRLAANRPLMNSWHSWTPNSRWLVFASKANGPYTQMWLTHIDADGHSAPPVVLDHMTAPDRAANIPEFVNTDPDAVVHISEQFLNDVSYVRAGDQFLRGGDHKSAIPEYRKALELNPNNAEAHGQLGHILLNQEQDPAGALPHLEKAIALMPQVFLTRLNLGIACFAKGDLAQAEVHYQAALQLNPEDAGALANYGAILEEMERWEEAALRYAQALELRPDSADIRCNLGRTLYALGDYDGAVLHWKETVRRDPNHSVAYMNLGLHYMETQQFRESIAELQRAVRADPANMEARFHLGMGALFQGSLAEAEINLLEVARAAPEKIPSVLNQLVYLIDFGRQETALDLAVKIRDTLTATGARPMAAQVQGWIESARQQ